MNQEMNFSHTHSFSNGTAEGVHANVQYVNADESHWLLAVCSHLEPKIRT